MSWHEPRTIAERLAARLGVPLWERAPDAHGAPGVLLADQAGLAALDAAASERLAALVVHGAPDAATSSGLTALRDALAARGLAPAVTTFATVPGAPGQAIEVPLVVGGRTGDERLPALLAAGPHALTLDAAVDAGPSAASAPAARVCVVSFEVAGMTGGGIGTASTSLAELLAGTGHDVTLLFTGWQEPDAAEGNERWRAHYAERGVQLAFVREPGTSSVKSPHFPVRSSYEVYCWLRQAGPFDVVHLPENMGHGTYAQLAKRQGSHFADTTFVVGTHGPTRWAAEANRVALTREEFLVNDALERTSVALADVLLGPSRYLHDYMRARGWQLPRRVHVQPYAVPAVVRAAGDAEAPERDGRLPDEIVFFGRLETRKGVATLCDALDLLAADDGLPSFEVTFLGPVAQVLGVPADEYIAVRAARWPWTWRIVSDRDQQGAAAYLRRPGVLAAMPSLVDNAPNTVSEAVALGIPLVAGRTGGTGELVAAEQRDDHMFGDDASDLLQPLPLTASVPAPDPQPLAELLRRRLTTAVEPARAPAASAAVDDAYDRWHRAVGRAADASRDGEDAPEDALPTLSACVLYEGDEALLRAQLDALAADDTEVVVADLRALPREPVDAAAQRGVALVQADPPAHGAAARAAAVAATSGELVAVIPPGDVPLPSFAQALRRAAGATGADVCSCAVADLLDADDDAVYEERDAVRAFVPLAGPPSAGLTHPAFSVGPYAIRRAALARLGGFAADARGDEADHELLNRAAGAGLALEVVPEPLAVKRRRDRWSTFRATWPHEAIEPPYDAEQWLRVERPLAERGGPATDLVGLLRGVRTEATRFERELHRQHDVYEGRFAEQRTWIDNLEAEAARLRAENAELAAELAKGPVQRTTRALGAAARRIEARRRR